MKNTTLHWACETDSLDQNGDTQFLAPKLRAGKSQQESVLESMSKIAGKAIKLTVLVLLLQAPITQAAITLYQDTSSITGILSGQIAVAFHTVAAYGPTENSGRFYDPPSGTYFNGGSFIGGGIGMSYDGSYKIVEMSSLGNSGISITLNLVSRSSASTDPSAVNFWDIAPVDLKASAKTDTHVRFKFSTGQPLGSYLVSFPDGFAPATLAVNEVEVSPSNPSVATRSDTNGFIDVRASLVTEHTAPADGVDALEKLLRFQIAPLPQSKVSILKAKMIKLPPNFEKNALAVDLHVNFPNSSEAGQKRLVRLSTSVNGFSINKDFDITGLVSAGQEKDIPWNAGQFISQPLIALDFESLDVPRFEANARFNLVAETHTSDNIGVGSDSKAVEVYLPTVIIHGYLFPGAGKRFLVSLIAPEIYHSLENYLATQDPNVNNVDVAPFLSGYTTDQTYQTLWRQTWQMSWTPQEISDWLHTLISDAIASTYASRVNIVGHSLGGLIGRYYVSDPDGFHPDGVHRVHKLIMIGTPNYGTSAFYTETSGWKATELVSYGRNEPISLWAMPRYSDVADNPLTALYDVKTGNPLWPDLRIVRPLTRFSYPESFPDQLSSPGSVSYFSVFATNPDSTDLLLRVEPTQQGWFSVKKSGKELRFSGDGIVVTESARLPSAVPKSVTTRSEHGGLPADISVQRIILDTLRD